ncbi:SDR family NAD(P)-dependent oxidoreductase [Lusitaniella coriacea]|uniref:SDR family NAD(P)-dependent oxidoreductase n=1 Tax=Lusitaniella coriacea TaxID=1983105 RepID=UPI003CE6E888
MNTKKKALITGANRGIGYAIAQGLLKADFQVIIGSRNLEKAKKAAEKLNSPLVNAVEIDIAEDKSIHKAFDDLNGEIDRLDILVNNAGIYPDNGFDILTIDRDLLIKTLNVNTFGAIKTTQIFLPLLEKTDKARVINYSSGYGQLAGLSADVPSYCLSKLTLNGATIMLADALASKNITVNAVDPGWVSSDMGGENAPKTVEQGADTAVWLATVERVKESGKLWRDRSEIAY